MLSDMSRINFRIGTFQSFSVTQIMPKIIAIRYDGNMTSVKENKMKGWLIAYDITSEAHSESSKYLRWSLLRKQLTALLTSFAKSSILDV